ncbi:MAG: hypothetical protein E7513_00025 [Ruminococcaceae bacterium]|nr:hypothetical protein [Oscillospiraceae bacterium]
MGQYRISELNLEILSNSKTLLTNLKPFETSFDYKPNLTLSITDDILLQYMEEYEGYTADVIECVYLSTEFSRALFDFNGFSMESTAVEYEGSAVLFSAPFEDYQVYEKISTDKVFSVDYPAIRLISSVFYAYGTPFGLNGDKVVDKKFPLKSIVFVDSERFDSLKVLDTKDMVSMFIRAVTKSIKSDRTKHTLFMLEKLMHKVKFYGVSDLSDLDFILERVTED